MQVIVRVNPEKEVGMKYTQGKYIILKKSAIAREMYSFEIHCPEVAAIAQPGQFVHIRVCLLYTSPSPRD